MSSLQLTLVFVVVVLARTNAAPASCQDGIIRLNPVDCTKFETCVHGAYVSRQCPVGTIYNDELHVCVFGVCGPKAKMIEERQELKELPSPGEEPRECPNVKIADIMVVVDQSTSVKRSGWRTQLQFLTKIVAGLPIGRGAVQVGLIKFSTTAEVMFKVNAFRNLESLQQGINALKFKGGITHTNKALTLAREYLTPANGARKNTQKVVIVLTDGASNHPEKTIEEAKKLHAKNIKVLVIGVGKTRQSELNAMATNDKYVLHTDNIANLVKTDFIEKKVLDSIKCITKCTPVEIADVVFLVDLSASIRQDGFDKEKFFIKALVNSLDVDKTKVRVALVTFSQQVTEVFDFKNDQNKRGLITKVDSMEWLKSVTNTHLGLEDARTEIFAKDGRKGVPHILVVLTDGASTEGDKTVEESKKLKEAGTKVIAIGVGSKVKMEELEAIASEKRLVLLAKDFTVLKNFKFIKNEVIQTMSCVASEEVRLESAKDLSMFI